MPLPTRDLFNPEPTPVMVTASSTYLAPISTLPSGSAVAPVITQPAVQSGTTAGSAKSDVPQNRWAAPSMKVSQPGMTAGDPPPETPPGGPGPTSGGGGAGLGLLALAAWWFLR